MGTPQYRRKILYSKQNTCSLSPTLQEPIQRVRFNTATCAWQKFQPFHRISDSPTRCTSAASLDIRSPTSIAPCGNHDGESYNLQIPNVVTPEVISSCTLDFYTASMLSCTMANRPNIFHSAQIEHALELCNERSSAEA